MADGKLSGGTILTGIDTNTYIAMVKPGVLDNFLMSASVLLGLIPSSAGGKMFSGSGIPPNSTGSNGDYYFDLTSKFLYGPKAGGLWGSGTSMAGATGATGETGAQGFKGDQGAPGYVMPVNLSTPATGVGSFEEAITANIKTFQATQNGTYSNGLVVSGVNFNTTDVFFYYIGTNWSQQQKASKNKDADFTVLTGTTWDWSVSNRVTKSLTANTVVTITGTQSGDTGWMEVIGNGYTLTIGGKNIPVTAPVTSVGFIKINNVIRVFTDNTNLSITFAERILSAAAGLSTGTTGYGGAANQQWFCVSPEGSVSAAGFATKMKFNLNTIPTGGATALVIRVWRKNGTLWDVIGSQSILFSSMIVGDNSVNITTPFSVQVGDRISGHYIGNVSNTPFTITFAGTTMYDVLAPAPATGYDMDAMSSPLSNYMAVQLIESL